MDDETVTIQEAMKILNRSEKRVRGYIKDGKLSAELGKDGRYHILKSDVEHLAKRPGQIQVDKATRQIDQLEKRITSIERQLEALTSSLDALTSRLDTLTSIPTMQAPRSPATLQEHKSRPSPRVSTGAAGSESKGLPDGAILASYFARAHGVNERTFADHCKKGIGPDKELAPVSQRPKPGREYQTEFYVMPEQMPEVLAYWRRHNVSFQEPQDET